MIEPAPESAGRGGGQLVTAGHIVTGCQNLSTAVNAPP